MGNEFPLLSAIVADAANPSRSIRYNGCCGDNREKRGPWSVGPLRRDYPRCEARIRRGVDGHYRLAAFATTTLVQAYVIPSASMEDSLLIGDHVLVDKLVFAPPGKLSRHVLPYRDVRRGDVIVFRYPLNIKEDYVKRAIGVPGDQGYHPAGE